MKKSIKIAILLLWVTIASQFGLFAVTVNVTTAGRLPSLLDSPLKIKELTLTGDLNGTDIKLIREMAKTGGSLTTLDISGANIVSGGDAYYMKSTTSDDVISDNMFRNCNLLETIALPESVTSIGSSVFYECTALASIVIPEGVTSIGSRAFAGCRSLASIDIPATVTSIGMTAFRLCTGLKNIFSRNATPPTLDRNEFYNVDKGSCKLYVPEASVSLYSTTAQWQDFMTIKGTDFMTSIDDVEGDSSEIVKPTQNGVIIETDRDANVAIFNLAGYKIYQAIVNGAEEIALEKGIYIVVVNGISKKIAVR